MRELRRISCSKHVKVGEPPVQLTSEHLSALISVDIYNVQAHGSQR